MNVIFIVPARNYRNILIGSSIHRFFKSASSTSVFTTRRRDN